MPVNLSSGTYEVQGLNPRALVARHKAKLQALMAVAGKMLPAIFGMFRGRSTYDGSRLFPELELASAA